MSDLNALTLAGARDKLVAKEITSVELTEACLAAIEGSDSLNALSGTGCRSTSGQGIATRSGTCAMRAAFGYQGFVLYQGRAQPSGQCHFERL